MRTKLIIISAMCAGATPAFAGEPCRSAKDLVNVAKNFYGNNPELTDIITPKFTLGLKGINGAADPTAMRYQHEGQEVMLPVIDGKLTGLEELADLSKKGKICRMVDGELAATTEGDSTEASMSFSFPFKRQDGVFTIDEIKEGAKDGSRIMNGLAPGGLGFAVPGLKGISIASPEGEQTRPDFSFTRNGEAVSVDTSPVAQSVLVRLKDIKKSKADTLTITSPYRLHAIFKFDPDDVAKEEAARLKKVAESDN